MKTDQENEFEKLKREKDFLQRIVDELPSTLQIIEVDDVGNTKPVWINKTYEKIYGYNLQERVAIAAIDFYHPDDLKQVQEAVTHSFNDKTYSDAVICRVKTKTGIWKWIYVYGQRFSYKENRKYMLTASIEITNDFAFNHDKVQDYMKEINQLKSQLVLSKITPIEKEVMCLLAKGKTVKEIGKIRNRSFETINNQKRNIFKKLGFTKLTELVCFCVENGLD